MARSQKRTNVSNRKRRVRYKLKSLSGNIPRLSVFISNKHIYAQVIDDVKGTTLSSASTVTSEFKKLKLPTCTIAAAENIGKMIATAAIKLQVKKVVFDRGSLLYHGRVRALADSARKNGLEF